VKNDRSGVVDDRGGGTGLKDFLLFKFFIRVLIVYIKNTLRIHTIDRAISLPNLFHIINSQLVRV
jgi:hypothetical protein